MSGIVGSKLNIRGSGLVGSLGTDGQHMLSAGAGKTNVFETVSAAADFVKIASTNASGSAVTLEVDNCFDDTTYHSYKIHWQNLQPNASGASQIYFRLLDASGSALSGSDYRSVSGWSQATSSADSSGENRVYNGTYWYIHYEQTGQHDTNYQPFIGEMTLSMPQNTTWKPSAYWRSNTEDSAGGSVVACFGMGLYNATPVAHRGIQFYTSSGANIHTDALVTVYGLKK